MAPYGSRRRRRATKSSIRKRSPQFKIKKQEHSENQEIPNVLSDLNDMSNLLKKIDEVDQHNNCVEDANNIGCTTPKGKKFRIPMINTCPPAPMKRRSSPIVSSNCNSLRRTPIAFFAPPDLELFFFFASDLCVNNDSNVANSSF